MFIFNLNVVFTTNFLKVTKISFSSKKTGV
jgi:hypothetical protein